MINFLIWCCFALVAILFGVFFAYCTHPLLVIILVFIGLSIDTDKGEDKE